MKLSQVDLNKLDELTVEQKTEIVYGGVSESTDEADVAILLGGKLPYMPKRAEKAAKLYLEGKVKYIVPTGGVKWDNNGEMISEAHFMTRALRKAGVPEEAIITENEALTTKENMLYATIQLNRKFRIASIKKVVIVTSPGHLRRSMMVARLLLPKHMEIFGAASEMKEEDSENWYKSATIAERVDKEIGNLKCFVDEKLGDDIEF